MESPSILEYARYHQLAIDHLEHVPLQKSDVRPYSHSEYDGALTELDLSLYTNNIQDEKLEVDTKAARLLVQATKCPPKPNLETTLDDPYRVHKLKVESPVLRSNHYKDLQWFQSGVDLKRLVHACKQWIQSTDDADAELAEILAQSQVAASEMWSKILSEKLQINKEVMATMMQAIRDQHNPSDTEDAYAKHLPKPKISNLQHLFIEWSSCLEVSEPHEQPPLPDIAFEPRSEEDLDGDNILPQVEKQMEVDDQICTSDVSDGSPTNVREVLAAITNPPIIPPAPWGPTSSFKQTQPKLDDIEMDVPVIRSPRDDLQHQIPIQDLLADSKPLPEDEDLETLDEAAMLSQFEEWEQRVKEGLNEVRIEVNEKTLRMDIPKLEPVNVTQPATGEDGLILLEEILEKNPIKPATISPSDEMKMNWIAIPANLMLVNLDEQVDSNGDWQDYVVNPQDIVRSEQLLWKEDGLRILDEDEDDYDDMQVNKWLATAMTSYIKTHVPQKRSSDTATGQEQVPKVTKPVLDPVEEARSSQCKLVGDRTTEKPATSKDPDLNTTLLRGHSCQAKGSARPLTRTSKLLASSSLDGFLDLRGRKFKKPAAPATSAVPLPDMPLVPVSQTDHVEASQTSSIGAKPTAVNDHAVFSALVPSTMTSVQVPSTPLQPDGNSRHSISTTSDPYPPPQPLDSLRTIVIDSTLVNNRPLMSMLAMHGGESLNAIYRELDGCPDVILNPKICVVLSNLQQLMSKNLPGVSKAKQENMLRAKIQKLSSQFETIFVVIVGDENLMQVQRSSIDGALNEFAMWSGARRPGLTDASVHPLWIVNPSPASPDGKGKGKAHEWDKTINPLVAWTWHLISEYALSTPNWQAPGQETKEAQPFGLGLLQDETVWEVFLRKAGMNAMAAQVVLGVLNKRPQETRQERLWGLRRFVAMSAEERHDVFDGAVGERCIQRVSRVLDQSW